MRIIFIFVALSILHGGQAKPEQKKLTVLFSTDLYGRFIDADCRQKPQLSFANLVGAVSKIRLELTELGLPKPVLLNTGSVDGVLSMLPLTQCNEDHNNRTS